jgi:hypothetical protein
MVIRTLAGPIRFAGPQLAEIRHVGALFKSADEERELPVPRQPRQAMRRSFPRLLVRGAVGCLFEAFSEAVLLDTLNACFGEVNIATIGTSTSRAPGDERSW